MVVLFMGDIALRVMPLELVAFRTFEPALRTTGSGPGEFQANKTVRMHRAYGDLAAAANVWRLRQYHDEEFQSDVLGNRNSYNIFDTKYGGIVLGDSFVVASGVTEAETLSGQLSQIAGARYYNAGSVGPLSPDETIYLASLLNLRSGIVVFEVLERLCKYGPHLMTEATPVWDTSPKKVEQKLGASSFLPWLTMVQTKLSPTALSPMRIISRKIIKRLQNGRLQPNPYWNNVLHGTLGSGDDMLFLFDDLTGVGDVGPISSAWVRYFEWYNDKLKAHNLKLVVLLVPNKFTVYGPLLRQPMATAPSERLIGSIAEQLQAKKIPVVNLAADLKARAAQDLPEHRYLYWRDDTHWNAAGISVAADSLRPYITPVQDPVAASAGHRSTGP